MASRTSEASVIAPPVYPQPLSATLLGGSPLATLPDLLSLIGLVVILGSELISLRLAL